MLPYANASVATYIRNCKHGLSGAALVYNRKFKKKIGERSVRNTCVIRRAVHAETHNGTYQTNEAQHSYRYSADTALCRHCTTEADPS